MSCRSAIEDMCVDIWDLRYELSNVTVGKATADANGNNIVDTYATKESVNFSTFFQSWGDAVGDGFITAWKLFGTMKYIVYNGVNASNSNDRKVSFPSGYSFNNIYYSAVLTIWDNNGNNLWSYQGRILEKATDYVKFKFQQANNGDNTTQKFNYNLIICGI